VVEQRRYSIDEINQMRRALIDLKMSPCSYDAEGRPNGWWGSVNDAQIECELQTHMINGTGSLLALLGVAWDGNSMTKRVLNKRYAEGPHPKGMRVKLTKRAADAFSKRGTLLSWHDRRGVVRSCNSNDVNVIWDGRRTGDQFPVERADD
jgi:hypothetical protein